MSNSAIHNLQQDQRFMAKVSIDSNTGCWNWTGSTNWGGYARITRGNKSQSAHRYAYMFIHGPVSSSLDLDHLCRNRRCVNPHHLDPVTRKENLYRGKTLTASRAAQTHCKRGHELKGSNLELLRNGTRRCKACKNQLTAEYRATEEGRRKKAIYDKQRRETMKKRAA